MADAGEQSSPTPTTNAPSASSGPTLLGQATTPGPAPDQQAPPGGNPPEQPPTPQGEPDEPKQPNGEPAEGEAPPPDEKAYEALSIGEGLVADPAALAEYRKLALEAKLPVETAQKILDLHGRMQDAALRGWQAQVQDWRRQTESDAYLTGGDVPNGGFGSIKDAKAAAGRFMSAYGDGELRQVLDQYGLGDHPALVRAIARAGRDMASDQLHAGAGRPRVDSLRARYPSMSEDFFSH